MRILNVVLCFLGAPALNIGFHLKRLISAKKAYFSSKLDDKN